MIKEILKRRSIRKYKGRVATDEEISEIIKAGMNAPSARNTMPWEFIVIKDEDILKQIVEINSHGAMILEAKCAIAVCGRELTPFWPQDLGATTQNMLLEATELNLGTCWVGIYTKEDIELKLKELLNIPDDVRLFSLIAVGMPDEYKEENNKFDEEKIHHEKWN